MRRLTPSRTSVRLGAACAAAALMLVGWTPASAAQPDRGYFSSPDSGVDPAGTTCEFPVAFSQVESGFFDAYSDANGDFVRFVLHIKYDATISANGVTLVEHDSFTRTLYADGTMRDAGATVHIQGPEGALLMRDAGQIVYSDFDETVDFVRGPHEQLFGASFCSALEG